MIVVLLDNSPHPLFYAHTDRVYHHILSYYSLPWLKVSHFSNLLTPSEFGMMKKTTRPIGTGAPTGLLEIGKK